MDVDTTKSASPAAVFDLTGVLGGLTPHCMRTTSPLELVWGSSLTPHLPKCFSFRGLCLYLSDQGLYP